MDDDSDSFPDSNVQPDFGQFITEKPSTEELNAGQPDAATNVEPEATFDIEEFIRAKLRRNCPHRPRCNSDPLPPRQSPTVSEASTSQVSEQASSSNSQDSFPLGEQQQENQEPGPGNPGVPRTFVMAFFHNRPDSRFQRYTSRS